MNSDLEMKLHVPDQNVGYDILNIHTNLNHIHYRIQEKKTPKIIGF